MVDMKQYITMAKSIIKDSCDKDIEVEFVKKEQAAQRFAELSKQYGREIRKVLGLFMPEKNGFQPLILVTYNNDDEHDFIEVFYHELQHAIDYYEVNAKVKKEYKLYFDYYTEFNANYHGFLRYNLAEIDAIPTSEGRRRFIEDAKAHLKASFDKTPKTFESILLAYMPRVAAIAEIEQAADYSLINTVPETTFFIELMNYIGRYQPTSEWYKEFKKRIDSFAAKAYDL